MFDHVTPTVFWPLFVLVWFIVAAVVGLGLGKIIRWCDTPENRYTNEDHVAEQKRRIARNGFKSKAGIQ
jgi:hypothetical protein